MTGEKAKKIFDQYNRKSDVVRCPYGRATIRKSLDSYARAAVNLYGVISREDLVNIFNKQNIDQTTEEEIYILLLPIVLKDKWYGFYKQYIVHYCFLEDFTQADYLLKQQSDKPLYIPEKNDFLKYVFENYEDNDYWWNVKSFMWDAFGYSRDTSQGYIELRNYITYGDGISELGPILSMHNLIFTKEEQLHEFINLIMLAKNKTRIWENNGYSPSELHELLMERDKNIIRFPTLKRQKIGRNELCPCGSGKKYKKCCAIHEDNKTAQLSSDEAIDFYETWFGLMSFVNEKEKVLHVKIKPEYPNTISDMMVYKVRKVLWEKPELIDEYISKNDLSRERIDILKLWRMNHKKGLFIILEYQPEYAVVIATNDQGEDRLYGIKGISNSISEVLRRELPVLMETVMLPYKGKIIYDSFMTPMQIGFAKGAKTSFHKMYDEAIKHGIIISLE